MIAELKWDTKEWDTKDYFLSLLALSLMVFLVSLPASSQSGEKPIREGSILQSGVDARAMGMGGAYVAVADNYSASYWNPAGITSTEPVYLGGMNYDKFGLGLNLNYLSGGVSPFRWPLTQNLAPDGLSVPYFQGISLGATYLGFSTEIKTRDSDGNPVWITYSERSFIGTTGFKVPALGSIGGSIKNYRFKAPDAGEDGTTATANGVGFDLGLLAEPLSNFYVGAAGFDISGTEIQWKNTPSEQIDIEPARYSTGLAYDLDLSSLPIPEIIEGNTILAGQYTFGPNLEDKISAGLEYSVSIFSLRSGLTKPLNGQLNVSAGAGIKINLFSADVAWVQNKKLEGEDTTDTVILSTEFTF